MRSTFRSVLVALVAVLALSAVAASGASAHEFRVEGKGVTGEEAFTGSGGAFRLNGTGPVSFNINCATSASTGQLQAAGQYRRRFTVKTCALTEPSKCALTAAEEAQMEFAAYGGQLVGSTTPKIDNNEEGEFANLFWFSTVRPEGCALPVGAYQVQGHWTCELHEAGVEAVQHEEVCKKSESHLYAFEHSATMSYTETIGLVSGKKWSAV